MKNKTALCIISLLLSLICLSSCAAETNSPYLEGTSLVLLEDEAVALADAPAAQNLNFIADAPGTAKKTCDTAIIDYSNAAEGYVMVKYTAKTDKRLKAQVKGPNVTYTYNLTAGEWAVFPLAEGDATYTVSLFLNSDGNKYATVLSVSVKAELNSEFLPFLYANQYVDYTVATETAKKAEELTANLDTALEKVSAVYDFVVDTLTYDKEKAKNVKSGYLPVLDTVLAEKKGICFDYAALMAGMLRSQNIPCRLVVGYAGKSYHAWIDVWTEESGWINGIIKFDGKAWHRMDPTFASSANKSASIMNYIGDGKNYTVKYLY